MTAAQSLVRDLWAVHKEHGLDDFPAEGSGLRRDMAVGAVETFLGRREPEFTYALMVGGRPWIIVVLDEGVHLFAFTAADEAETRFLGSLAGGSYVERMTLRGEEITVKMRFEHSRLPAPIEVVAAEHEIERTRLKSLRDRFQQWALAPGGSRADAA
jgi:hypothetical protein